MVFMQIDDYQKDHAFFFTRNDLIKKIISFIQEQFMFMENQNTIIILLDVLKGILDESKEDLEKIQVIYKNVFLYFF